MPGTWTAGPDADGDGRSDLYAIGGSTLTARASDDGRTLWTITDTFAMPETLWMPSDEAEPSAKGPPFVVGAIQLPRPDGSAGPSTYRSIAAYSTRDGRRLWTSPDTDLGGGERGGSTLGWSYQYPRADFADLDGDGTPEVLVSLPAEGGELRLRVVSGRDGRTLWHAPIVDGAMTPDPRPAGAPIADFDRDGHRDLAMVVPPSAKPTRPEEAWARVDVRRGLDGRSAWPAAFPLSKDARHLVWPEPSLGDLDGDGVPEVLVVRHSGYTENHGYACEYVVLDGRSGLVHWTWSWDAGFPAIWAPIVLKSPEASRRRVAMGLNVLRPRPGIESHGGFGFVILDAAGGLVRYQEVGGPGPTAIRGGLAWASADLDGDGTDELLHSDGGFLCAGFGPDLRPRWRKAFGSAAGETVRVRVVTPSLEGSGAAVLLWTGRDVFGIEGSRGDVVWRGRAPGAPVWGTGGFPHMRVLSGSKATSLPYLAFGEPIARSEIGLLESTQPTTPDGRYRPTTARPGAVSGATKDAP